jgi:hypothetical protein
MKLTVITDDRGELVGAMQGHARAPDVARGSQKTEEFRGGLMAGPGQTMHELEVPDSFGKIEDPDQFGEKLIRHVRKEGLLGAK